MSKHCLYICAAISVQMFSMEHRNINPFDTYIPSATVIESIYSLYLFEKESNPSYLDYRHNQDAQSRALTIEADSNLYNNFCNSILHEISTKKATARDWIKFSDEHLVASKKIIKGKISHKISKKLCKYPTLQKNIKAFISHEQHSHNLPEQYTNFSLQVICNQYAIHAKAQTPTEYDAYQTLYYFIDQEKLSTKNYDNQFLITCARKKHTENNAVTFYITQSNDTIILVNTYGQRSSRLFSKKLLIDSPRYFQKHNLEYAICHTQDPMETRCIYILQLPPCDSNKALIVYKHSYNPNQLTILMNYEGTLLFRINRITNHMQSFPIIYPNEYDDMKIVLKLMPFYTLLRFFESQSHNISQQSEICKKDFIKIKKEQVTRSGLFGISPSRELGISPNDSLLFSHRKPKSNETDESSEFEE